MSSMATVDAALYCAVSGCWEYARYGDGAPTHCWLHRAPGALPCEIVSKEKRALAALEQRLVERHLVVEQQHRGRGLCWHGRRYYLDWSAVRADGVFVAVEVDEHQHKRAYMSRYTAHGERTRMIDCAEALRVLGHTRVLFIRYNPDAWADGEVCESARWDALAAAVSGTACPTSVWARYLYYDGIATDAVVDVRRIVCDEDE